MRKIKVIDAPCGAGKTSWSIQYMNDHQEKSYVYCTPFLDEIGRIKDACEGRFVEPQPWNGSKLDNFNELLGTGSNIAVTHTTFLNANTETLDRIRSGSYTLIIDEVLDVVTNFNSIQRIESQERQKVTESDIQFLLDNKIISVGDDYRVKWLVGNYSDENKYAELQKFANLNRLYCMDRKMLLTIFPVEIFDCFDEVYVMTYLLDGSTFKYYMEFFSLEYEKNSIMSNDGRYELTEYNADADIDFRRKCKGLIKVFQNERMNDYSGSKLSVNWFKNSTQEEFDKLKNNLGNFFRRCVPGASAKNGDLMWTCIIGKKEDDDDEGQYYKKLKGTGYTKIRPLTAEEKKLPQDKLKKLKKETSCFVSGNCKATNIYIKRWVLAYCINLYMNPQIMKFFTSGNVERRKKGLPEINPSKDMYGLSGMLQWIFRSRIRNGEPIIIYIPSKRMRKLLQDWFDCKDLK